MGLLGLVFMQVPGLQFPEPGAHTGGLQTPIPHMYGAGFAAIETAIQGHMGIWLLLALVILKPLATSMTLGSGNSGGVFAPSLFIGAMLGGFLGHLFSSWFPEMHLNIGAFALVGMAALFSATARAPLTAMLIVFEMSGDYSMILPLMVAGVSASYFSEWLHPESIYTIKLAKRGIRFFEGRDMDIMQGVSVDEVMRNKPVTVNKDASFYELMALFQEENLHGFPVLDKKGILWGIITLHDVEKAQEAEDFKPRNTTVADMATKNPITIFSDEPIWKAIQKMAPKDLARLPVIPRDGSGKLLGVISRSDILRAYDVGVVRKQRGQLKEHDVQLRKFSEAEYMDFVLQEEDKCNKAMVRELSIPETVSMVSIRRGGQIIIPKGETRLQSGDVITVYGKKEDLKNIKELFNSCSFSPDQN